MNAYTKTTENPTINDDYLFAASNQDCTGLIPSVTHGSDEVENYEEIYPYLPRYFPEAPNIPAKINDTLTK